MSIKSAYNDLAPSTQYNGRIRSRVHSDVCDRASSVHQTLDNQPLEEESAKSLKWDKYKVKRSKQETELIYHKKLSSFLKQEIAFQKSTKLSQTELYMQKFFPLTKSDLEASDRMHAATFSQGSIIGSEISNKGRNFLLRTDSMGGAHQRANEKSDDLGSEDGSSYINNNDSITSLNNYALALMNKRSEISTKLPQIKINGESSS